jgi:hypothetical protein
MHMEELRDFIHGEIGGVGLRVAHDRSGGSVGARGQSGVAWAWGSTAFVGGGAP